MADNDISLLIKALLSPQSITNIKAEIQGLQDLFNKSPIQIKIDDAQFKQFSANLSKVSADMNKALNIKPNTSGITEASRILDQYETHSVRVANLDGSSTTRNLDFVETYTDATGKLIKEKNILMEVTNKEGKLQDAVSATYVGTANNYKKTRDDLQKLTQQVDTYKQKMLGGNGFAGEIDIFAAKNKGNANLDATALDKVKTSIQNLSVETPNASNKMKEFGNQFSSVKLQAAQAGDSITRALEGMFKFMRFYFLGGFVVGAMNVFKTGITYVTDLNNQLTKLRIEMNLSDSDLVKMASSAQNLAKELGSTVNSVLKAAEVYSNANETVDSIISKTKAGIVLSNLSGMDVTSAQDAIQAISLQFNLLDKDAMHISDVITKIAAGVGIDFNKAVSTISDAVKVSGNVAEESGISLEKYASIIASTAEITRLPGSTLGQSMKTIITRTQRVTTDETSAEDISAAENALRSVNIEVRKSETEFKNFDDVMSELALKWDTLSGTQKSFISYQLSGTRQINVMSAMLKTWQKNTELTTDALNSQGFAMEKNAISMESNKSKMKLLTAASETFWQNMKASDFINGIIVAVTSLIGVLGVLINNPFTSFLLTVTASTVAISLLGTGLSALRGSLLGMIIEVFALNVAQNGLLATTKALSVAMFTSPLFLIAASVAVIYLIVKAVDFLTVSLEEQKTKVDELSTQYDELKDTLATLQDEFKKTQIRIDELTSKKPISIVEQDELDKLKEVNKELQIKIDLANIEAKNKAEQLGKETVELYKKEFGGDKGKVSNKAIKEYQDTASSTRNNAVLMSDSHDINAMMGAYAQFKKMRDEALSSGNISDVENFNENMKYIENSLLLSSKDLIDMKDILSALPNPTKEQKNAIDDINNALKYTRSLLSPDQLFGGVWKELTKDQQNTLKVSVENGTLTEEQMKKYQGLNDILGISGFSFEKLKAYIKDTTKVTIDDSQAIKDRITAQTALTAETLAAQTEYEKYGDTIKTLTTFLSELSTTGGGKLSDESLKLLTSKYPELLKDLNDHVKLQTEINKLLSVEQNKAATDAYVTQTNKLKELYTIQQNLNKEGKISGDDAQKIIENYDSLIPYLNNEKALKEEMIKLIGIEENVQREAFRYKLELSESYFNTQIKGNQDLVNILATAYGTDAKNFKTVVDAKKLTNDLLVQALGISWKELYGNEINALNAYINAVDSTVASKKRQTLAGETPAYVSPAMRSQIDAAKAQRDALTKIQDGMNVTIGKLDLGGLTKSAIAAGATTDVIKEFLATLQDIDAITEYAHQLNQLSQQMAEATGDTNALIRAKIEEQNIYKNLNAVYQSNIDKIREQMTRYKSTSQEYKDLEDALRKYTTSIEDNKIAIITLDKALAEHDTALRDKTIETQNLILDAVKNRIKKQYDLESKALDDKITLLNREKQILTDNYNDSKKAKDAEDLQTQLTAKEIQLAKLSRDNSGFYEKDKLALADEIAKLREQIYENSLDAEVTAQQKAIDDQISAVEQQKQNLTNQYNLMEEDYRNYWAEVTNILNGSQTSILDFLKNNTDAYKTAGELQKNAYLEGWGDTLDMFKGIQSGTEKTSSTIKTEIGTGTGTSSGGTPSTGGSTPSSSTTPFSGTNLKVGSKGSAVVAIQQKLGITADGIFGSKTLAAVKAFQSSHGLSADGIVGKDTWAGLFGTSGTINLPSSGKGVSSSTPYSSIINEAAIKYGLDPAILAGLIRTESGFDPNARSTAGAVGLTQLMPATAKGLGVTNRNDPYQSIMGGANYLAQQIKRFNSVELGIRAYFWGPGNVSKGIGNSTYQNTVLNNAKRYKEGGLVDYTGIALVDGTKTRPEAFLDPEQTNVIKNLVKGLANIPAFRYSNPIIPAFSGNNMNIKFENKIVVESGVIGNDYDANQLGQQIGNGINKFFEDAQRKSGLTFTVVKP